MKHKEDYNLKSKVCSQLTETIFSFAYQLARDSIFLVLLRISSPIFVVNPF
jgi:hypothetical protein